MCKFDNQGTGSAHKVPPQMANLSQRMVVAPSSSSVGALWLAVDWPLVALVMVLLTLLMVIIRINLIAHRHVPSPRSQVTLLLVMARSCKEDFWLLDKFNFWPFFKFKLQIEEAKDQLW